MKRILLYALFILMYAGCEKASDTTQYAAAPGGGQGGSMARFTIVGNYLYAVDHHNLNVFFVGNPADPVFKQKVSVGFEIETIYSFGDKLFIGSTTVVHIFSIANPEQPQKLSQAISPEVMRRCDPVVAKDTVAYATLRSNGPCGGNLNILAVYDIKNITAPVQRSSVVLPEPYGLGYSGTTLYVCDRMNGLMVFDISNAWQPQLIRSLKDGEYIDVIPYYNFLICWVKGGVIIYDINQPQQPQYLTSIQ